MAPFFPACVAFFRQKVAALRDWLRGYSDDDLRFVYEIVANGAERELTKPQLAALRACPEYLHKRPQQLQWGINPKAAR